MTEKLIADERRNAIIRWLSEEHSPITGSELAKRSGVSRQVIVQDMSILKAKGEPIFATAQGYLYFSQEKKARVQRLIAVQHKPDETADELYTFVDCGLTVVNVSIEHAIYGELTGSMHVSNRQEVDRFCSHLQRTNANLLSELTNGVHLHLVEGDHNNQIESAIKELDKKGYLLKGE
ncbi:transcription repressor NadR [Bacillus sp. JCM 19041]|uniref:transcription repressor NadR n=1 Tax=Bacillus sp. JCM 19041 TaxID=1460637 RepID=UPI0006D09D33